MRKKKKAAKKVRADLTEQAIKSFSFLRTLNEPDRIEAINTLRSALSEYSPFRSEPVDFIRWVKGDRVHANDYNPNSVAPPEMELLRLSIVADGYTQPIVTNQEGELFEVVDGFHRNRVGKECPEVTARVRGYLPVVQIRGSQTDVPNRIASTIRHNRARGKHQVEKMSDIVIELKRRNWSDEKISKNLGMDKDEILRLCQISGLSEVFADQKFSQAWDVAGEITEADFQGLTDDISTYGEDVKDDTRTVNTSDEGRIFHTWDKWECHKAGFYATAHPKLTRPQAEEAYRAFLSNPARFEAALKGVVTEWKHSCEHYLTNVSMNRIAWLGQAAAAYAMQMPSMYRGGFYLMTEAEQNAANALALKYLNVWLVANGRPEVTMEQAYSYERQADIY